MKIGNVECYGIIYKIENLVNHKIYIGQTTRGFKYRYWCKGNGIERVYNYYIKQKSYNYGYNDHLLRSIKKYGFDNFKVDEVFDIAYSEEELNKLEYMYIKIYNLTNTKYGYNNKDGGDNYKKLDRTIKKQLKIYGKPIYSKTDKIVFASEPEAIKYYGFKSRNIILNAIKDNRPLYVKDKELWFEKEDYFTSTYNRKGIICLNDLKMFGTLRLANDYYGYKSDGVIINRCKGNFKNVKDGLFFMYINDYYDKLKNVTSEENKSYIYKKYYEYKNNIYTNKRSKKDMKNDFLNQDYIIDIIKNLCKYNNIKYVKNYINNNYNLKFHVGENDIKIIKNKFNIRKHKNKNI